MNETAGKEHNGNFWSLCFKLDFILRCFSLHLYITNMLVQALFYPSLPKPYVHTHTATDARTHTTTTTLTMQHMFINTQAHTHTLFSFTSHMWHLFLKSTKTARRCWQMGETYPSWSIIEPTVFLLAFFSMMDLQTTSHIQLRYSSFLLLFPNSYTLWRKKEKSLCNEMLMITALFFLNSRGHVLKGSPSHK